MWRSNRENEIKNRDQSSGKFRSIFFPSFDLFELYLQKSQVKNVDDLDRVEQISKDIRKKSETLAQGGESTPFITKGKYLNINFEYSIDSFPSHLIRSP